MKDREVVSVLVSIALVALLVYASFSYGWDLGEKVGYDVGSENGIREGIREGRLAEETLFENVTLYVNDTWNLKSVAISNSWVSSNLTSGPMIQAEYGSVNNCMLFGNGTFHNIEEAANYLAGFSW
jgi:hypothetical protein